MPKARNNLLSSTAVRPPAPSGVRSARSASNRTTLNSNPKRSAKDKRQEIRSARPRSSCPSDGDSDKDASDGHDNDIRPLVVKLRGACVLLCCGMTHLYKLMNAGELQSFLDGKIRKITTASIEGYIVRQLEASQQTRLIMPRRAAREEAIPG